MFFLNNVQILVIRTGIFIFGKKDNLIHIHVLMVVSTSNIAHDLYRTENQIKFEGTFSLTFV